MPKGLSFPNLPSRMSRLDRMQLSKVALAFVICLASLQFAYVVASGASLSFGFSASRELKVTNPIIPRQYDPRTAPKVDVKGLSTQRFHYRDHKKAEMQPRKVIEPRFSNPNELINGPFIKHVKKCLLDSPHVPNTVPWLLWQNESYKPPSDIELHYREMLDLTEDLRLFQYHTYANYEGPWIENAFIEKFCCDRPLSDFGGLVPLFIQWTDIWLLNRLWPGRVQAATFLSKLRKDVIYVTVSQHDQGLIPEPENLKFSDLWNVLVFSAGGYGHIPVPLLVGVPPPLEPECNTPYTFMFAGQIKPYNVRERMKTILDEMSSIKGRCFTYQLHYSPHWRHITAQSLINLSPRGWGRSSFRTMELIHMGKPPVYLWNDHEWVPYKGTPAAVSNFGWSVNINNFAKFINETLDGIESQGQEYLKMDERVEMMNKYKNSHYTLDGVMERIDYFFKNDPRSDLSCVKHPRSQL